MSVANELSSDVAFALLQAEGASKARELKEVLEQIRSALSALSAEERQQRRAKLLLRYPPGPSDNGPARVKQTR